MNFNKLLISFSSMLLLLLHSTLFAAPQTSYQLKATMQMMKTLQEKVHDSGKPVSVIVKINDQGAFHPARPVDSAKLEAAQDEVLAKLDGNISNIKKFRAFPFLAYTVASSGLAIMRDMDSNILSLHEDKTTARPTLMNSGRQVGVSKAWDAGFTGKGQHVAVVDDGVDSAHPFLANKVVLEACFSTSSTNVESLCPNGSTSQFGRGAAAPCDDCLHGTHVAGIVAGENASYSGIAPDAKLFAIQVFFRANDADVCGDETPPCYRASDSSILQALDLVYQEVVNNGLTVAAVNLSLGGDRFYEHCDDAYAFYKDAIDWLKQVGVATVAAAGNESYTDSIIHPACVSSAISVGSVCDVRDTGQCANGANSIAGHSNIYPYLSLLAPGAWITSSIAGSDSYARRSGTSMATPHVSGAWALMKERNPLATVDDILRDLQNNAVSVDDIREGGIETDLKALKLSYLENAPTLIDASIKVIMEEPVNQATVTGVGNLRGWAVGPEGIDHVDYFLDDELKSTIPYGGGRSDVANANPDFPDAASSGYSQAFSYGSLSAGEHKITIRAYSKNGQYKDVSSTFNVIKFHKNFFRDPAAMDVSASTVSQDGSHILLDNIKVEGQSYDVQLQWQKPMQQFGIVEIK